MLRHWLRPLTICTSLALFGLASGLACQEQPARATPDIPATVTAQFEQHIQALPTPAPLPTYTPHPTAAALPAYTPYPTYTPLPTYAPLPTYTPYPASAALIQSPMPTPVLTVQDPLPVRGADGLYDLGFGRLMFLHLPGIDPTGAFSPRPLWVMSVSPPGKEWEDREAWNIEYVQLKCSEFQEWEEEVYSGYGCFIVE